MQLLRKENDPLNSLIGRSFNEKSKFQAEKILSEIHSRAQSRTVSKTALCYILDKDEIKGVGGSTLMKTKDGKIVSNLILDNFGVWLAAIFRKNVGGNLAITMPDDGGVIRNVHIYNLSPLFNSGLGNSGSALKVGSGTTAPTRSDFEIETDFVASPENLDFALGSSPTYFSGPGNFQSAGSIIAGGSGTVNESVHELIFNAQAVQRTFTIFRDIITPAQAFLAGQTIALSYTIQL